MCGDNGHPVDGWCAGGPGRVHLFSLPIIITSRLVESLFLGFPLKEGRIAWIWWNQQQPTTSSSSSTTPNMHGSNQQPLSFNPELG